VMNRWAFSVFEDADLLLLMVDIYEKPSLDPQLEQRLQNLKAPSFLLLNKIDQAKTPEQIPQLLQEWSDQHDFTEIYPISALKGTGVSALKADIIAKLPESPPYFPKDEMSDRPMRFFISEMIREQILENYKQEGPYSCHVDIESFKEDEKDGKKLIRIEAIIYVNRKTQKSIIIGRKGASIKKLGSEARAVIEEFLGCQVYLHLFVKVREGWRDDETKLRRFGYS